MAASVSETEIAAFWRELVGHDGDLPTTLDVITAWAAEVVGEGSVLMLVSESRDTLEAAALHHPDPEVLSLLRETLDRASYRVGEGAAGVVVADRKPMILDEEGPDLAAKLSRNARHFTDRCPIRSAMIIPLTAYGEVVGTLGVIRLRSFAPYSDDDLAILEALGARAALAIADSLGKPRRLGLTDYEAMFRYCQDGVMFTSPDGRILAANPAACEILRRSEQEICRLGRHGLVVNDDPRATKAVAQRAVSGRTQAEIPMLRGDGTTFIANVTSTTFTDPDGQSRAYVSFRDVSDQVALRRELEAQKREFQRLAEQDSLSGLLNRRGFVLAAQRALDIADREQVDIQLLFCDVDDLKSINDTLGHQIGDVVLQRLGHAISSAVRSADVAARVSGDEFAVLLFGSEANEVKVVIDRITTAYATAGQEGPPVGFSVGVVSRRPGSAVSLDDLLQEADRKMYERKAFRRGVAGGEGDPESLRL